MIIYKCDGCDTLIEDTQNGVVFASYSYKEGLQHHQEHFQLCKKCLNKLRDLLKEKFGR